MTDSLRAHPAEPVGVALRVRLADAIEAVEIGAGSEHYRYGRETMRDDAISAVQDALSTLSQPVGVSDAVVFQAMRAYDGKAGYSKMERLRATLEAVQAQPSAVGVSDEASGAGTAEDLAGALRKTVDEARARRLGGQPQVAASLLEGRIPVRSRFDQGYNKGLEWAAKQGATPVASRDRIAVVLHDRHCPDRRCEPSMMGAYYDQADALLAAGVFREPPTLEEIAKAIHAGYCVHAWDRCGLGHQDDARRYARQVVAIMGGAERAAPRRCTNCEADTFACTACGARVEPWE